MRKFFVERELPKIGRANRDQLRAAASRSNEALRQLEPRVQWIQSYVAEDKTFCVYRAEDE
ncbi:MAG: nickel-binding protein [Geminicoccaceae bacterium]